MAATRRKTAAKKTTAAKKKVTPKKTSAKKSGAKKSTAKKSIAKTSTAKKRSAKKSSRKKPASQRKYGAKASESVETEMRAFNEGKLRSSSGQKVTSRKQAIAIGLSEARRAGGKVPKKPKGPK